LGFGVGSVLRFKIFDSDLKERTAEEGTTRERTTKATGTGLKQNQTGKIHRSKFPAQRQNCRVQIRTVAKDADWQDAQT
jgi:hypothetical protein